MHALAVWLKKEGKTPSGFAREIGVPASTIQRIIRDDRSPTHQIMERVIVGTHGQVLPNDYFDLDRLLEDRMPGLRP